MLPMPLDPSPKIVSRRQLAEIVRRLKRQGQRIVTTNGSFDLLHIGHVTMLQEAKSLGDVLIVGLNSDASVKRYKGPSRPICSQQHRAAMLAALNCTDYISIFEETTPIELLTIIQSDLHVNSPEHGKECVEREVVERYGGQIYLAQLLDGMSTSRLIERIVEVASRPVRRAIFINRADLFQDDSATRLPAATVEALRQFHALGFQLVLLAPRSASERDEACFCHVLHETFGQEYSLRSSVVSAKRDHLEQTVTALEVSLAKSFLISSAMADIDLGRSMNCKTIFLSPSTFTPSAAFSTASGPHWVVHDVQEAVEWVAS
ncbi:adenylyltransferase/cytidyltransferase family protein [candidate division KSB3 bacterium]|uniref:Adenylyltransferase/cytidyltransferase family protein n=1 Tax=candidate division KSB3 bacterium TaxID=2044937 RepID=A0A9D5Q431_9BACT|nr:adenylyltransferase/cytidyltransferase family protein [candidate division KSB3 bacterium]MBD3323130.1 adenylyltransferase/cytidyltransferase family protein [candidate division KSB3 bacterium]